MYLALQNTGNIKVAILHERLDKCRMRDLLEDNIVGDAVLKDCKINQLFD